MKSTETRSAVRLSEVIPAAELSAAVADGLVRVQRHPRLSLRIFNYTEQAVYGRIWTTATTTCRGLIVDDDDTVIARPWPKFFNHGEHADGGLDLHAPVEVTDKADGSLGILYPLGDGIAPVRDDVLPVEDGVDPLRDDASRAGWAIATRGSFASDQAEHATAVYTERYLGRWQPNPDWTYLFEIIYPANRIVLDYAGQDDLVLLGAVEIATGTATGPLDPVCSGWPGPRVEVQAHGTLAAALAAEPRNNAEGLVVRYLPGSANVGQMVKIKQEDYLSLHRLLTGLTARRLWERAAVHAALADDPNLTPRRLGQVLRLDPAEVEAMVQAGPDWLEQVRRSVPEEFLDWIAQTTDRLTAEVRLLRQDVETAVAAVQGLERREIAQRIAGHPQRGMIFATLDGRSVLLQTWAAVRPAAERAFVVRGEEVA